MLALFDNDVIEKLTVYGLLEDFIRELGLVPIVLGTARFRYRKAHKSLTEPQRLEILDFCEKCDVVEHFSDEEVRMLGSFPGIDQGEAILFAAMMSGQYQILITGDKRSLGVLSSTPELREFASELEGRVCTLESVIAFLIERLGFDVVRQRITANKHVDTAMRAVFGSGDRAVEAAVKDGLSQYSGAFGMIDPAQLLPGQK